MSAPALSGRCRIALVQMRSGPDPSANLVQLRELVAMAHAAGADLVATPENTLLLDRNRAPDTAGVFAPGTDPCLEAIGAMARSLHLPVLVGSTLVAAPDGRALNRSHLYGAEGQLLATYDKLHLFDVDLGQEKYQESARIAPGTKATLAELALPKASRPVKIGFSICYDLRFAALYQRLAQAGADIIAVPSAFTVPTGLAHWHVLLRARAIETGCFILAPAQAGAHPDGRHTFGHSLVVSPWGQILAEAEGDDPQLVIADIDLAEIDIARRKLPTLSHMREFEGP